MEELKRQLSEIQNTTSRIDERVQMLVEKQSELTERFIKMTEWYAELAQRVTLLESRNYDELRKSIGDIKNAMVTIRQHITSIETQGSPALRDKVAALVRKNDELSTRLDTLEAKGVGVKAVSLRIGKLTFQTAWVIITCWVLYKLGLNG